MPNNNKHLNSISVLLLASSLAVESDAMVKELVEAGQTRLVQLQSLIPSDHLGFDKKIWLPHTNTDIRDYFKFHQFEVNTFMQVARNLLKLEISDNMIRIRSLEHDWPKIAKFEELSKYGYKGWKRSIALPFLSALFDLPLEQLEAQIPKSQKYLRVSFSTRLLLSFGISQENYQRLFPNPEHAKAILAELKNLPNEINATEDLYKVDMEKKRVKHISEKQMRELNLIEHLADFLVRTQNPLARLEYGKRFKNTSQFLQQDIEILSIGGKRSELSFISKKLLEDTGERTVRLQNLKVLKSAMLLMEGQYFDYLKKARNFTTKDVRAFILRAYEKGNRVNFMDVLTDLRRQSLQINCKDILLPE